MARFNAAGHFYFVCWSECLIASCWLVFRFFLASVEVVPIEDGVKAEGEGALSLPTPEGTEREHDDVALSHGLVEDEGAVGEGLAAG